jgi:hypothetical protein
LKTARLDHGLDQTVLVHGEIQRGEGAAPCQGETS